METNHEYSKQVAQHIVDGLQIDFLNSVEGGFAFHNQRVYTLPELITYIHPYVSNATFEREKQIVRRENRRTLVTLARTIALDAHLDNILDALGYETIHNKNQI